MSDVPARRNSASSTNTRLSSSSSSTSSAGNGCNYCLSNGFGFDAFQHSRFNCPRLASLHPCAYCGASGYDNHTKSHCPQKPRLELAAANCGSSGPPSETQSPYSGNLPSRSLYLSHMKCGFCLANGYSRDEYMGHIKQNCPRLLQLRPCEYCGASGMNNHTRRHCPQRPRINLPLKNSKFN